MLRFRLLVTTLLCCSSALSAQQPYPHSILITDVTVIDMAGHPPAAHQSVVIEHGRIKSVGAVTTTGVPANAIVIEGRGKFLLPGLWNMHVHLGRYDAARQALEVDIAQGITGVRDMGSPLEDVLRIKAEAAQPGSHLPVVKTSGPIIQGPLPFSMPLFVSVNTPAEARDTVTSFAARGVDFIKIQDAITHELYVAVADAAKKNSLPFVGHVPPTVTADEVSDLGQRSIEHLGGRFWGVLLAASTKRRALHRAEEQMYDQILDALNHHKPPPDPNMRAEFTKQLVESYSEASARRLFRKFHQNGTWNCPTLVALQRLWDQSDEPYTPEDKLWASKLLDKNFAQIRLLDRERVGLLAGTDLPPSEKNHSLSDELIALVKAGLTPAESLATATRNPAKFFGILSDYGTVERGKIANLVLLDGNPLDDIRNVSRISEVLLNGVVVFGPRKTDE